MNEPPEIPILALLALAMIENGDEVCGALNEATAEGRSQEFLREWTSVVSMLPDRAIGVLLKEYRHTMEGINGHMPTGHSVDLELLDKLCHDVTTVRDPNTTLH